jgi:hypothetical protein
MLVINMTEEFDRKEIRREDIHVDHVHDPCGQHMMTCDVLVVAKNMVVGR